MQQKAQKNCVVSFQFSSADVGCHTGNPAKVVKTDQDFNTTKAKKSQMTATAAVAQAKPIVSGIDYKTSVIHQSPLNTG